MTMSDVCGVTGLIGMALLAAAFILSGARKDAERSGDGKRALVLRRIVTLCLVFGTACWCIAGLLVMAQMAQSVH
ncbi:MAG: hypothetical protein IKX57_02610 [Oscillospiraceae bacterium]|nr:hypothetical protein [Oscillospiraceae bacterium]